MSVSIVVSKPFCVQRYVKSICITYLISCTKAEAN